MKLTRDDYAALERSYITKKIADAAGLYRVESLDGRELIGRKGGGDYSGIVFPYRWPGENYSALDRLRLDNPPVDAATGKPEHKYLSPLDARNRVYFPPCPPALLSDASVSLLVTEGEKKVLALWRMSLESSNSKGPPPFFPIGLPGVWSFRGTIGTREKSNGQRAPEKGVLPDFDRILWKDRRTTILFDANTATNSKVQAARRELARELTRRGAEVWLADLPAAQGVNGCDDFLYLFGAAKLDEIMKAAHRYVWRAELLVNDEGHARAVLANAIIALRSAPEWAGVLAWDEFAMRVVALREAPWGPIEEWRDQQDRRTTEWLQRAGIFVKLNEAGQAVQTVAQERAFHPVREYLNNLTWDGISRIDDWLTLYAGANVAEGNPDDPERAKAFKLLRAIGARWLISAVARIFQP